MSTPANGSPIEGRPTLVRDGTICGPGGTEIDFRTPDYSVWLTIKSKSDTSAEMIAAALEAAFPEGADDPESSPPYARHHPSDPQVGDEVAVRDSQGRWLRKTIAYQGDVGQDFPCYAVRWASSDPDEWTPWPIEDVAPLAEHPDAMDEITYFVEVVQDV